MLHEQTEKRTHKGCEFWGCDWSLAPFVVAEMLRGYHKNGPHTGCEFFEIAGNQPLYIVLYLVDGYHINGPHSGPYEKFTA